MTALGRKRSFDACARVVRHSASHGEPTIRTKREGYGDLAGRRIAGGLRTSAQVSRATPSRRFYRQLTHSSHHGFLDPLDPLVISSRVHLPSTTLACSVHSWLSPSLGHPGVSLRNLDIISELRPALPQYQLRPSIKSGGRSSCSLRHRIDGFPCFHLYRDEECRLLFLPLLPRIWRSIWQSDYSRKLSGGITLPCWPTAGISISASVAVGVPLLLPLPVTPN